MWACSVAAPNLQDQCKAMYYIISWEYARKHQNPGLKAPGSSTVFQSATKNCAASQPASQITENNPNYGRHTLDSSSDGGILATCHGQAQGDLRLVNDTTLPKNETDIFKATGRLEIFWNGRWGTFCGINQIGGDVACRQLGFSAEINSIYYSYRDADNFTKEHLVPKASDDILLLSSITPLVVRIISCRNHSIFFDVAILFSTPSAVPMMMISF